MPSGLPTHGSDVPRARAPQENILASVQRRQAAALLRDEKHQERLPPARSNHKMADAEAAPEETGRQPLSAMWRSQGPSPSRVKVYNEEALLDLIPVSYTHLTLPTMFEV